MFLFSFFSVVVASLISVVGFDDAEDIMVKFACECLCSGLAAATKCILDLNLKSGTFLISCSPPSSGHQED